MALTFVPPPPPAESLIFIDLSPLPGEGPVSPIATAPAPPSTKSNAADALASPAVSTTVSEAKRAKTNAAGSAESPSSAVNSPSPEHPLPPTSADATAPQSPAVGKDVLAMVEEITGQNAAALAQSPPLMAPISEGQMAEIRFTQALRNAARAGGGCSIDAALREAFTTDPAVQAALLAVPVTDKSVSNALQLWDGQWTSGPADGALEPLLPIKALTIATVRAAPRACRTAVVKGPRFIIVPVHGGVETVVVIGSGDWRWADVLPRPSPTIFRWLGLNS